MAAINLHYPKMKVFQLTSTQVAAGAKIYTYEAGTSTDKATYSDQALTTANANPVIADSNGEAQVWLLDDGLYKIVINDSDDVLISNVDNIGTASSASDTGGLANLVSNGSFELNSGDDGTPTGWTLNITGASTIQIDQADTFHGDSCLEFVGGASGAGTATSGVFEVQSSKELNVRFSLKASAATVGQTVEIFWWQDSAATSAASTASTSIYSVTTTAPTSWEEQLLYATAPSNALFAQIKISGSTDAGTTRYDDVETSYIPLPATQSETDTGISPTLYVTPLGLANTDSFLPSAVTGYDRGKTVNLQDDSNHPVFDVASVVASGTWESIGPTDSGATNIWSGLDVIPGTATHILLRAYISFSDSTATPPYNAISIGARSNAGSSGNSSTLARANIAPPQSTNVTVVGGSSAPLDADNIFDIFYSIASASNITMAGYIALQGWIE